MEKAKNLIKSASVYVLLGFLPLGINFLLLPVLSLKLSEEEYGILTLATLFSGAITIFIGLGLDGAFSRYYFQFYTKPKILNSFFSTLILTICGAGLVVGILLQFAGDFLFSILLSNDTFTYSDYGVYVFFTTITTILHGLFLVYFRNEEKVYSFSATSISFFLLSVTGILIGVVYLEKGALGSIVGRFVGTIPVVLFLLLYFIKKWQGFRFDVRFLRITLSYTLPLIPYLFILFLYNNVDKIMIERGFGEDSLSQLGIYNLAFQISTAIQVIIYSIFNTLSPQVYKTLEKKVVGSLDSAIKLYKVFYVVIMGVIVCTIACSNLIFDLFIDEKFAEGANYLGLLCLIYIPQLYYVIYTITFFYHKITKVLPYISLVALIVGVTSNYILIPMYGLVGVCLATLITKITQFAATYYYLNKYNFKEHGFSQMNKYHVFSFILIVTYCLAYYLFSLDLVSIQLINLLPITLFALIAVTLFRKEVKSIPLLMKKVF